MFCGSLLFRPVLIDLVNLLYCLGYCFLALHMPGKRKGLGHGIIGRKLYS